MADAVNFNRKSLIVTSLVVACLALFYYQWKGYGSAASKQEPVGKQSAHLTPGDSYTPGGQLPQATLHAHQQAKHSRPPQRTLDRLARPGPMPGSRPSPGGPGSLVQPQPKGSGVLSIIMPVYSVGIVIFFVYTVIKVVSRRNSSAHTGPRRSCSMTDGATINTLRHSTTAAAGASSRPLQSAALPRQQQQQQRCHPTECCKKVSSAVTTDTTAATTDVPATRAAGHGGTQVSNDGDDVEIDELRRRLEETEKAMELIMSQLGNVSAKLVTAKHQQQQQQQQGEQQQQGDDQGDEEDSVKQLEKEEKQQQQQEDEEESVEEQQQSSSEDLHQQLTAAAAADSCSQPLYSCRGDLSLAASRDQDSEGSTIGSEVCDLEEPEEVQVGPPDGASETGTVATAGATADSSGLPALQSRAADQWPPALLPQPTEVTDLAQAQCHVSGAADTNLGQGSADALVAPTVHTVGGRDEDSADTAVVKQQNSSEIDVNDGTHANFTSPIELGGAINLNTPTTLAPPLRSAKATPAECVSTEVPPSSTVAGRYRRVRALSPQPGSVHLFLENDGSDSCVGRGAPCRPLLRLDHVTSPSRRSVTLLYSQSPRHPSSSSSTRLQLHVSSDVTLPPLTSHCSTHSSTALKCDGGDVVPDELHLPVTAGHANNSGQSPENCTKDNAQHPAVAAPFGEPELVKASADSSDVEHLSAAENGTKHATSVAAAAAATDH